MRIEPTAYIDKSGPVVRLNWSAPAGSESIEKLYSEADVQTLLSEVCKQCRVPGPYRNAELTEPGYYWWLPQDHIDKGFSDMSVLTFSPALRHAGLFNYQGLFWGPIPQPVRIEG